MRPGQQPGDDREDDGEPLDWPESGLTRRTLLRTAGAASVALPVAGVEGPALAAPARFFSAAELAVVDELAELIIPSDAHSPGAREAQAGREIDRRLADLYPTDPATPGRKRLWREGLRPYLQAVLPGARLTLLTEAARGEPAPKSPPEIFFVELKREVARAYYTSEVGVMKEMEYKGNTHLEDYVGHDAALVPLRKGKTP